MSSGDTAGQLTISSDVMERKERENDPKHAFHELGCTDEDMVYLSTGAPNSDTLCRCANIMHQATNHRMMTESEDGHLFQYGVMQGDSQFREALAEFLSREYEQPVYRENLFVTCGASHGLYLLISLLFRAGTTVFVEEPTYFLAISMFRDDLGLNVVGVETDSDGIVTEELDKLLHEHNHLSQHVPTKRRPFWSMLYTVPVFNNPTGRTTSAERCRELIKVARKHNILVVAEDVYNLLNYDDCPPPTRLFALDNKEEDGGGRSGGSNVVSNCTFSKILAPGLRLGWLEAPRTVMDALTTSDVMRSGGSCNNYLCGVMASVLTLGLQHQHLQHLKKIYGSRMRAVCKILAEELPKDVTFYLPKGGYFVWLVLPTGFHAKDLSLICAEKFKIDFVTGDKFSICGKFKNCLRICISHYSEEILMSAVKKLCVAIKSFSEK